MVKTNERKVTSIHIDKQFVGLINNEQLIIFCDFLNKELSYRSLPYIIIPSLFYIDHRDILSPLPQDLDTFTLAWTAAFTSLQLL